MNNLPTKLALVKDITALVLPVITFVLGLLVDSLRGYFNQRRKNSFDALTKLYQPLMILFTKETPANIDSSYLPLGDSEVDLMCELVQNYSHLMSSKSFGIFLKMMRLLQSEKYYSWKADVAQSLGEPYKHEPTNLGEVYTQFYTQIELEYYLLCAALKTRKKIDLVIKKYSAKKISNDECED